MVNNVISPTLSPLTTGSFRNRTARRKYWILFLIFLGASLVFSSVLLTFNNPAEFGTSSFWLIAQRRLTAVIAMAITAVCQAVGTVAFQTVTNNRIITPSIMGFDALYRAIHTSTVFFFGTAGLVIADNIQMFVIQLIIMIGFSLLLYGWLLTSKNANLHAMLLIGVVLGGGLGSVSAFMQRLLTPTEFDVLTSRLFGSVSNADPQYYPIAIPLVLIVAVFLFIASQNLNIIALGRDTAYTLGVNHRAMSITVLISVSILLAVSTALVGPMVFLGFLAATLAYQFCDTYDHRFIIPMAAMIAFVILSGSYFLMNYVFYAEGVVSILIEMIGGSVFLIVLLRKGKL
ncbi:iron chelate uptake ABC transporter family permease subunit [Corynebacterium poyangense]|uniref:Iron chelate uptake ABC transporter family permease subunit n=1 Tax=Corynebacterium poyangense TaxID=2684405 RepID=A0A7H0SMQ7_9CORY|nr:iron chelate uptake ABC transporter family permease subunit [Corynebacterium poyangense]QNQ89832.1 iron chelate uptake ABC transporter family permease subunit [Corynebacterium poyangense]